VAEPVIHDYGNIEHRDAVLAYDGQEPMRSADGQLVQRWDGVTFKTHPATGEAVPDETALVVQWRYLNPRAAQWPQADFIVGNPPFIGAKYVREALGDGYAEALRVAWPSVPDSADFVMHWWQRAAELTRTGKTRRFGLITTNSLRQSFNSRVVEAQQTSNPSLSLTFAIPDHPWVDERGSASVRIAMTVGSAAHGGEARLLTTRREELVSNGEAAIDFAERRGVIHSNLRLGANVAAAVALRANSLIASPGVKLHGSGFIVTPEVAANLGLGSLPGLDRRVRPYRNGRDLTDKPRNVLVIDLLGLSESQLRLEFPTLYQHVSDNVRPERAVSPDRELREQWWLFRRTNRLMRDAIRHMPRYIATTVTAKHRLFQFLPGDVMPDDGLLVIGTADAVVLGALSSSVHCAWALAAGSTLEDRPRYIKTRCFDPFPFPSDDTGLTPELTTRIRALAEQLDAHRKAQQAAHPELTLTGLYNVLDKLRRAEPLNAKDKLIHTQGLVSVLKSLHDELDAAVLAAYGWSDLQSALTDHTHPEPRAAAVETLLERLVALNARRAAEETAGTVRWLRPDFQCKTAGSQAALDGMAETEAEDARMPAATAATAAPAAPIVKTPWPVGLPEQIKAVAEVLAGSGRALTLADLEARFTARGRWRERLPTIIHTLEALGRARRVGNGADRWQAG
jgi:hypothetical protein